MSILERLRSGTDSTATRLIIGAIMLLFILWIPSGRSNRYNSTGILAEVGSEAVGEAEFERLRANALRQAGGSPTKDEIEEMNKQILEELIRTKAELQEAERLGIAVSDEEVARVIVKTEAFAGADGKFDQEIYQKLLKNVGMTKAGYEAQVHDQLVIAKLQDLVAASVTVSEAEVRQAWQADATRLELAFVRLPATAFYGDVVIDPTERDAWLKENTDKVKARYDERFERQFNLPKRYELRSIVLRTDIPGVGEDEVKARAEAVRAQAAAGADFSQLAARWSESLGAGAGGRLGTIAASQLDPAVAAAADAAGKGKLSEVVKTPTGFQILWVDDILDAKVISFDEAKTDLATAMLQENRVGDAMKAYAAKVIEGWKATGLPPAELLATHQLEVESTGEFSLGAGEVPRLGSAPALLAAIGSAGAGTVLDAPIEIRGAPTLVAVKSRTSPDEGTWAAEKEALRAQLLARRRMAFAQLWLDDLVKRSDVVRHVEFGKKAEDPAAKEAKAP